MTNEEQQKPQDEHPTLEGAESPFLAKSIGVVVGGLAGAALGRSIIGGKVGAAIGGVAGAIAGGLAGNPVAGLAEAAIDEIQPTSGLGYGADNKPIELPSHYSWEQLQALSKPQGGQAIQS